jgi:hypothetical protein
VLRNAHLRIILCCEMSQNARLHIARRPYSTLPIIQFYTNEYSSFTFPPIGPTVRLSRYHVDPFISLSCRPTMGGLPFDRSFWSTRDLSPITTNVNYVLCYGVDKLLIINSYLIPVSIVLIHSHFQTDRTRETRWDR